MPMCDESDKNATPDEITVDEGSTSLDDVYISTARLVEDLFVENDRMTQLLHIYEEARDSRYGWFETVYEMMEALGYRREAQDNTYNNPNDLDDDFVYEVWVSPDWKGDWIYRTEMNDDGYIPEPDHRPEWAKPILDEMDEDGNETLPQLVVVCHYHIGGDSRYEGNYNSPVLGYFEGDYTVPFDLCLQWHLEPCEEDDDEAAQFFAQNANEGGYLDSSEATYHLESKYGIEVVVDEDGNSVPFNPEKRAFLVQNENGQRFWAYPDRHYFGQ